MGGDTYSKWDPQSLTGLSEELRKAHTTIVQEFDDLETECEATLSQWEGAAQEAYRTAKIEWNKRQDEMNEILNKFQTAVVNIQSNYQATEQSNTSTFS